MIKKPRFVVQDSSLTSESIPEASETKSILSSESEIEVSYTKSNSTLILVDHFSDEILEMDLITKICKAIQRPDFEIQRIGALYQIPTYLEIEKYFKNHKFSLVILFSELMTTTSTEYVDDFWAGGQGVKIVRTYSANQLMNHQNFKAELWAKLKKIV